MKFASFDGRGDVEHSGLGLMEISEIFLTETKLF